MHRHQGSFLLSIFFVVAGCGDATPEPEAPVTPNPDAPLVAMGGDAVESACALDKAGAVRCWGNNAANQLGLSMDDFDKHPTPSPVVGVSASSRDVDFGVFHACVAGNDGAVTCWGGDYVAGMMGEGTGALKIPPTKLPMLASVKTVTLGAYFGCALHEDGSVSCWGDNRAGQLGLGMIDDLPHDGAAKVPGLSGATSLAAGSNHACVILGSGAVSCWGAGSQGQLGDGGTADRASPAEVTGLSDIEEITAGGAFACARSKSGEVSCWGENGMGQLGDGSGGMKSIPTEVALDEPAISIAAGEDHACAATLTGRVHCWGLGGEGQLGTASLDTCSGGDVIYPCKTSPVKADISRVFRVMAGGRTTCGAKESGTLTCFGRLGEASGACKGQGCASPYDLPL